MVTLRQNFEDLGKIVTGKALDDRASCWIAIRVLEQLKRPNYDVYAVFTVQEEVGVRGATTSSFHIQPDIGIALDTTLSVDIPGSPIDQSVTQMGKGTAFKVLDRRSISTRWLLDEFVAVAKKHDIPYQLEVLPFGGTDAGAIQLSRQGIPSITISTPSRYVHTVTEMVAKADLEAAVSVLKAYLES
jgi:endoglucanase